ncbi:hypothetical protein [Muricoccus radiodurans]|uniref:hypothetical protein n=1 Tax=Muricoccus radiodurans TaxID=2231721 RepID=UPI003CF49C04
MSLQPKVQAHGFAEKLRLTAAALGCTSQKELALAFHRAHPDSAFDLARSYKWIQGRTLPRSAKVFEEWAALLDLGRSAAELLACSPEVFRRWITERHGPVAVPVDGPGAGTERPGPPVRGTGALQGGFACFSHAQSPYFRGRIIRGSLTFGLAGARGGAPVARYAQAIAGGMARADGTVRMYGQTPCLELHAAVPGLAPIYMTLFRPTPPASVLAGMMLSFTVVDPDHQPPYATRFLAVRVPDAALVPLEASNRYLAAEEWPPSSDLAALGLAVGAAPELDACLAECLGDGREAGSDRLPAAAVIRLTAACDRVWLATEEASARTRAGGTAPRPAAGRSARRTATARQGAEDITRR